MFPGVVVEHQKEKKKTAGGGIYFVGRKQKFSMNADDQVNKNK